MPGWSALRRSPVNLLTISTDYRCHPTVPAHAPFTTARRALPAKPQPPTPNDTKPAARATCARTAHPQQCMHRPHSSVSTVHAACSLAAICALRPTGSNARSPTGNASDHTVAFPRQRKGVDAHKKKGVRRQKVVATSPRVPLGGPGSPRLRDIRKPPTRHPQPAKAQRAHAVPLLPLWVQLCFSSAFLYSGTLCHIAAACPLSGLSKLGSPSKL